MSKSRSSSLPSAMIGIASFGTTNSWPFDV